MKNNNELFIRKMHIDASGDFMCAPMDKEDADKILARIEANKNARLELMPDEQSAINMMWNARERLTELGWRDPIYCPKDGSTFLVIEPGSTGVHKCHYSGEWPNGTWWITDERDMYPSRPVLFKTI